MKDPRSDLTPEEASAALGELAAGQRAVSAAERRGRPALVGALSVLTLVDYGAKDHVADRRVRRLVSGACQLAGIAITVVDHSVNPVQPFVVVDPDDDDEPPAVATTIAALVGWLVAERLIVVGVRRSGVRWPNTLAGVLLAIGRPVAYIGLVRLLPRPPSGV